MENSMSALTTKLKDQILYERGATYNVAQFASFDDNLNTRFMRVKDGQEGPDFKAVDFEDAVRILDPVSDLAVIGAVGIRGVHLDYGPTRV